MKLKLCFLIGLQIFLFSCSKEPEACFTTSNNTDTYKVNQKIRFTSCSINAKKHEWDFGDGIKKSSAEPIVEYAYKTAGIYTARIIVESGMKKTEAVKVLYIK